MVYLVISIRHFFIVLLVNLMSRFLVHILLDAHSVYSACTSLSEQKIDNHLFLNSVLSSVPLIENISLTTSKSTEVL